MDAAAARAIHARGAGSPLPPAIRALMEPQFGVDFSEVRVHTSSEAQESAAALNAKAFTHRNHIWLGRNQSPSNVRLMAHELTHVVQQGSARPLHAASRTPVPQTLHPGPAKASTASGGKAMPVRPAAAPARVQRWNLIGFARSVGGAVVSGARAVGRAATRVVEGAMELARDALIAVVREIAPEFAELIERDGILGFLKKMVSKGISAVFGGVLDKIRGILHFDQIAGAVRRGVGAVSDVMGQLARNDCRGLNRAAKKVMDFFSRTFGPVIKKIRAIGGKIKDFVTGIVDTIAVPVFEFLSKVGGKLWQGIKAFIKKVGDIFGAIKSAIGKAWDKIKGWFGIGADEGSGEGGGLWNWIKKKAASAWSAISDVASRLSGPLKVVGGVLVALSPAGPVLAVIHFWPQLKRAFQWVVQKWNDMNIVVRARNYLNNTLLPMLHGALTSVSNGLQQAGDWIANTSQRIDSGLADAEGALGGSVILAPLKAVVSFLARGFRTLTTGVSGILRGAFARIRSVFVRLQEYIKPIWEAIKKIIAIAVNPFGIPGFLLGNIWKIIPNCIKGPLINFILRVLLRFVEALPPFIPPLGLLWPFIRSGLIGFLKKMLSFSVERKVKVSNKMGNIISGGSFGFAMGYLKGLALGLWDAIIGPFKGIADLFHLPELIRNFAHAMGEQFQNLVAQARRIINWVNERAGDTLQSLINSARDLLDHPARIIEMIKKAIEAALGAVQSLGASLAGQMMAIFEQPDEQIGEQLGNITGSTLASAVLSYFTAGAAGGASLIGRVAGVLSRIGKFLRPIIQGVLRYMPRVVSIVKKIANLFARAKSAASKFLGKIINFFKRIIGALKRALGKVKRFVKGVVAKVKKGYRRLRARIRLAMRKLGKRFWNSRLGKWLKKKFGKQLHAWHEFIKYVRRHVVAYRNTGVTKSQLKEILDAGKSQFKAGVLFTVIHRSGPKWGIKALPKAPAFPFSAKILMDPASRLKQAKGAIKRAVNRLPDESMSSALISEALLPIRMKYHFSQLDVVWNQAQEEWDIEGAMSPRQKLYWVKNLKGYHTGSASDPIPMYWYKLPGDYQPITLLHNGAPKTVSPGSYSMITAGGVTHRIGVGGTPVSQGTVLTRTPSIRLGAEKDFSTFLAAAGHSWLPDSPDHVKDLGFGGPDLFSNLWPISRAANQSFGFYGTRMRYKVRGQKNKVGRSTISHMMGKSFKVVGFKRKHPSPGGKDGQ
ncbi:MAG: DUF4157 domain-containing protein [Rhizomicrobium sp.]